MRLGSLFTGIGAPEQGALRVYDNVENVFACEYDKYARQSFEANYDIAPEHFHVDINDMDGKQYQGKVDVIVGGSPCQAFSIAGLKKGLADKRGQLIWQYYRIIKEAQPQIFVYENVKGMVSDNNGQTLKDFLEVFRGIGYNCHYEVVNTKDYGVPQNRERVYIVGFKDADLYHRFSFAPKVTLTKRLKDVLEDNVDEKYYLSDEVVAKYVPGSDQLNSEYKSQANTVHDTNKTMATLCAGTHGYAQGYIKVVGMLDVKGHDLLRRVYSTDGICRTITAVSGGGHEPKILEKNLISHKSKTWFTPLEYADFLACNIDDIEVKKAIYRNIAKVKTEKRIKVKSATTKGYEEATTSDSINLTFPESKRRRGRVGKQVAQTLDCACNQAVVEPKIGAIRGRNPENPKLRVSGLPTEQMLEINENGTSNCLTTVQKDNVVVEPYRIRKLTPRECLRLQDFPDTFKQVVSNSQMYKQAGNSMSVNILEMIFNQIEKAKSAEPTGSLFDFMEDVS